MKYLSVYAISNTKILIYTILNYRVFHWKQWKCSKYSKNFSNFFALERTLDMLWHSHLQEHWKSGKYSHLWYIEWKLFALT